MKIKLRGLRTTQELRQMLHDAVDELERLGVGHVKGANLYFTPTNEDGEPVKVHKLGKVIDALTIREPYRSAADEHGL